MISLIVAKASNNVIGDSNDLPWYLPADLRHFKEVTTGHPVIMGRKTYESVYNRLKKPLPNRRNIVISASLGELPEGFELAHSLDEALQLAGDDGMVYIIGGATIYAAALESGVVDELNITEVKQDIPGDTMFPDVDMSMWQEISREPHQKDDKNKYDYDFVLYGRK